MFNCESLMQRVQADLNENHCELVQIIQLSEDRPFVVVEATDKYDLPLIFKIQWMRATEAQNLSARQGMIGEVAFTTEFAAVVRNRLSYLSYRGRHRTKFPEIIAHSLRKICPYILMSKFQGGQVGGGIHWLDSGVISRDDLWTIIELIQAINGLELDMVRRNYPGIHDTTTDPDFWYNFGLMEVTKYEEVLKTVLTNKDDYKRMRDLLEEQKEFLRHMGSPRLTAADINPSNMLKLPDGSLGMFDFERLRITSSPAHDFGFLYIDMWNSPVLQLHYLNLVRMYHPGPKFRRAMRLDIIFNRSVGELNHWLRAAEKKGTADAYWSKKALPAVERELHNALHRKGNWNISDE